MSEPAPQQPVTVQHFKLQDDIPAPVKKWAGKITLILLALLVFQLPLAMVDNLASERAKKQFGVRKEIAKSWGDAQLLKCAVSPDSLDIAAVVTPEIRYRGIYESVVYTAEVEIKAKFGDSPKSVTFCLNDAARLQQIEAEANGKAVTPRITAGGIEVPVAAGNGECRLKLKFRGSESLNFAANAKRNRIVLKGAWGSPGFIGDILPDTRKVDRENFAAEWNINRFSDGNDAPEVGVNLCLAAGTYQQVERTMTYATFFLIVFFFTLLAGELLTKTDIHPLQYLVAAGAPVLFYLMLLAFSEHIGFTAGYAVSAVVIVAMVTGYARMFLGRTAPALAMGGVFVASYALNFIILRMEDMALLAGSVVLAVVLGVMMLITGRINRPAKP